MSCEKETSQVSNKRKSVPLNTPRYVIMNTRDVKQGVRMRLHSVYPKYTDKIAVQIKDFITCLPGRTTQYHCLAYLFCYTREILKYVKSDKLRDFLDFMVTTRINYYTRSIIEKRYVTKNTKKRFHATSLTQTTKTNILKRQNDNKSRVNTDKHQRDATERRNKFQMGCTQYFDIIQSKSFEEEFCCEELEYVIKRMDHISEYKYFYEFKLTSQTGDIEFTISSLERDYKLYSESKCSNVEDVPETLIVDALTCDNGPAEGILDSSSTNCNDNNDGHHSMEQFGNEDTIQIEHDTIMNENNTSRTDEVLLVDDESQNNNNIDFDHNGIFIVGIGFLNYGRTELNEMAKDNHWLDLNDVLVPLNIIRRRKHNVHYHNDVIIFDKSVVEYGDDLDFHNVTKNIFAACICEKINKRGKGMRNDKDDLFHFMYIVLYRETNQIVILESCCIDQKVSEKFKSFLRVLIGKLGWGENKRICLKNINETAAASHNRWCQWFFRHEKVIVEDPKTEPICGPVVVAGVHFTHDMNDDWSTFGSTYNSTNVRIRFTQDIFTVELVKFLLHLEKEEVPDVTEEDFNITKKRSIACLTNIDCLNDEDIEALRLFRKETSKVSKEDSIDLLINDEHDSDISIDDRDVCEQNVDDENNDDISDEEKNNIDEGMKNNDGRDDKTNKSTEESRGEACCICQEIVPDDKHAILQQKKNQKFVNVCSHLYHLSCSTKLNASKIEDGGQKECCYCKKKFTHIKIVDKNSSRVSSLEDFEKSTCRKCRGDFKNDSDICRLIVKNCTLSDNVNCCDAKYHFHCISKMKEETRTKESLKCMECEKEFELVSKLNPNVNNMRLTKIFRNEWKDIENFSKLNKEERQPISYIKDNCLKIKGLNLSIQTMFDYIKIETNKKDLLDIEKQIPYNTEELVERKKGIRLITKKMMKEIDDKKNMDESNGKAYDYDDYDEKDYPNYLKEKKNF